MFMRIECKPAERYELKSLVVNGKRVPDPVSRAEDKNGYMLENIQKDKYVELSFSVFLLST